ncbi:MAG: MarR family transcriptional regulator [Solirubrobacterales bacterium]|nr:MarR family transcriptional regulator [Solirubrobacterales bacterium]
MDSEFHSATAAAHQLGTSVPRVVRAIERLGIDARQRNGRMRLRRQDVARLRAELGVSAEVPDLTPVQANVLAALRSAPLGLASIRAIARRAGVSPTAASRAVVALQEIGLLSGEHTVLAAGIARSATVVHLDRRSPRWRAIAPALRSVQPPARHDAARDERVPTRLRHLFWNTAPTQLERRVAGPYIARRLLRTMDIDGLAWGAANLTRTDWLEAQRARGLAAPVRALARNLAAAADR